MKFSILSTQEGYSCGVRVVCGGRGQGGGGELKEHSGPLGLSGSSMLLSLVYEGS